MQFVSGLPQGVYVGQTRVAHEASLDSENTALQGFNLALHVGDDAKRVQQHRMQLLNELNAFGVNKVTWMNQTHSVLCHRVEDQATLIAPEGDGLVTSTQGHALMMMTADCLPVVLGNANGTEVANLHAGWKGLANGIMENTISAMQTQPTWAWLGAAISQANFEIGAEVKAAFCDKYPALESAFINAKQADKFYADLYAIARYILAEHGISQVYGGDQCTYRQAGEYFSYRREAKTGRMATFVFMAKNC
jgi:polyphenol oxidase